MDIDYEPQMESISEEKQVPRKGGVCRTQMTGGGKECFWRWTGGVGGKGNVSGKRGVRVRYFCLRYKKEPNNMYMFIKSLILNKNLLYRFLCSL